LLSQNIKKESAGARRKILISEKKGAYVRPVRQAWIIPDTFFTPYVTLLFSSLPCRNMRKAEAKVGGGIDKLWIKIWKVSEEGLRILAQISFLPLRSARRPEPSTRHR
jgi:hypothetical protein